MLDVRSPKEFALSHIPTAINFPVLNDEEYERIGTLYHQDSFKAKILGSSLICQNISKFLCNEEVFHPSNKLVLYCARGGQRSLSFALVLEQIGFDCERIGGGYKSYRKRVLDVLSVPPKQRFLTLYGMTGCGKSELIALNASWSIDIEGLAKHYGSSFGDQANGFISQPSPAMFENLLFEELEKKQGIILVEGESKKLGKLVLPTPFFESMHQGVRILVVASMQKRVERIVKMYQSIDEANFTLCMQKIRPYIKREYFNEIVLAYKNQDFDRVALILLEKYYDRVYSQKPCDFEVCSDDLNQANEEIRRILEGISAKA